MSEEKIIVPPIKCQGIKTKLIPFIRNNIETSENGIWIEPFLGSGVVAFNVAPKRALLTDKNQYIIALYRGIQDSSITGQTVREFLEYHSPTLEHGGAEYYHKIRDEFNKNKDPLYFLFLNRADFNGMIRFNRKGEFNVPFCQKPNRFSKAYITKICNQVNAVRKVMAGKDWTFACQPWQDSFKFASKNDCIYIDPPYTGRDTCYVGEWPESEAVLLSEYAHNTPAKVYLSMWKENEFRKNEYLYNYWSDFTWHEQEHFYHVGARETNRHPMIEVLAVKEK